MPAQTALRMDSTLALHTALSPLLPLWREGVLGLVPAAGLAQAPPVHVLALVLALAFILVLRGRLRIEKKPIALQHFF
jgi:hypothetical protein